MSANKTRGSYHIGGVARATGISTHTIRVWERRYGAVKPGRTPGGTRVYTEAHVAKLALLKQLSEAGRPISTIASLSMDELRSLRSLSGHGTVEERALSADTLAEAAVTSYLRALETLDMERAERVLLETVNALAPLEVVVRVIAPIVERIGERWMNGTLRIGHEHAAVGSLRNLLGEMIRAQPNRSGASIAVAATLPGEMHEIGALMSSFVATACGWRVVYLGTNLPVDDVVHAIEQSGAVLLLLSLVNPRAESTCDALRTLLARLPGGVRLLVGGRSAAAYSDIVDLVHLVGDLPSLQRRLSR